MEYDTQTTVEIVKEIFKLPCDKETNMVKYKDVMDLIHKLIGEIPEEEQKEILVKLDEKGLIPSL